MEKEGQIGLIPQKTIKKPLEATSVFPLKRVGFLTVKT